MKRLAYVLMGVGVITIAGCGDKSRAIEETRQHLKDSDSAKFGDVAITDINDKDGRGYSMKVACVTVNSKNSYGGYTGDQQAMLILRGDQIDFVDITDVTQQQCVEMAKASSKRAVTPPGND